ncbi:hypothetical protein DUNSADRAFT_16132 [Dunaliella salina]|uniref:Encoded protein n=1 Tax=Dunaliella salina TaxID=3046 RepID=A0ABQ7H1D6_DUNSA|nr:hypothetical protein DUNSADRAFT_16132 [Dunaliella salina]|eukprot:KAF5840617.1 hypothetical protein DUNSADRAFT_16132 [Dunaliella salina]
MHANWHPPLDSDHRSEIPEIPFMVPSQTSLPLMHCSLANRLGVFACVDCIQPRVQCRSGCMHSTWHTLDSDQHSKIPLLVPSPTSLPVGHCSLAHCVGMCLQVWIACYHGYGHAGVAGCNHSGTKDASSSKQALSVSLYH